MDKTEYLATQTENEVLRRRYSEIKEKARGLSVAVGQYTAHEITRSQLLQARDALEKTINQPTKEDRQWTNN